MKTNCLITFPGNLGLVSLFRPKLRFFDLINLKINSLERINTKRGYEWLLRFCRNRLPENPTADRLDNQFASRFVDCVAAEYSEKSASFSLMITRFNSVMRHAYECGDIPRLVIAVKPRMIRYPVVRNLEDEDVKTLYYILQRIDSNKSGLMQHGSFALSLFFLDIALQGLAPVDLANIRVGDLKRLEIKTEDKTELAYILSAKRKKTGVHVRIVAWDVPIADFIELLIKDKQADDYLIPCFSKDMEYSPEQRQNRLSNYFNRISRHINRIISREVEEGRISKDSTLAMSNVTFYYARHAYCNLLDSIGISHSLIQRMVGHRTTVLERSYLRPPSITEQLHVSMRLFKYLSCNG